MFVRVMQIRLTSSYDRCRSTRRWHNRRSRSLVPQPAIRRQPSVGDGSLLHSLLCLSLPLSLSLSARMLSFFHCYTDWAELPDIRRIAKGPYFTLLAYCRYFRITELFLLYRVHYLCRRRVRIHEGFFSPRYFCNSLLIFVFVPTKLALYDCWLQRAGITHFS